MEKKKKIFVLGTYGCGNRGDEAILANIVDALSPYASITVANGLKDDMKKYMPVQTVQCRLAEGKLNFGWVMSMILSSFEMLFSIAKSDMLIYGGGSSIHDLTKYNLPYMFFWQKVARLFGAKVCYSGMGIGPISTSAGKRQCARNLKKADYVFARDRRGMDILKQLDIQENAVYSADIAFSDSLEDIDRSEEKYITVSMCSWFESDNFWNRNEIDFSKKRDSAKRFIQGVYDRTGLKMYFVPTFDYDVELGMYLQNELGQTIIECIAPDTSFAEYKKIISGAYLHIGMRMHSLIFALRAAVPIIPIVYDGKVVELIKRIQYEDNMLTIDDLAKEKSFVVLDRVMAAHDSISDDIRSRVSELKKMSQKELMMIKELLENG